jgi:hypothetical protein
MASILGNENRQVSPEARQNIGTVKYFFDLTLVRIRKPLYNDVRKLASAGLARSPNIETQHETSNARRNLCFFSPECPNGNQLDRRSPCISA